MSITSVPSEWLLKEEKSVICKSLAQGATKSEPCTSKNKQELDTDFVNLRRIPLKEFAVSSSVEKDLGMRSLHISVKIRNSACSVTFRHTYSRQICLVEILLYL